MTEKEKEVLFKILTSLNKGNSCSVEDRMYYAKRQLEQLKEIGFFENESEDNNE